MEATFEAIRADMDVVGEYQRKVFERQVATERAQEGAFVSDRAFDNLAYAAEHSMNFADLLFDPLFTEYMDWVSQGVVFFLRPHRELLKEDGVRAGLSWESVVRIDGMVKLMLEQHRIAYLPIDSMGMQERARAVEFVLHHSGFHKQLDKPQTLKEPASGPKSRGLAALEG
jgi:hypothetical protein